MYESYRNTELPDEKIYDSTEIPNGETTAAFTNLTQPLNLSRRERIVGMEINLFSVVIKT